MKHTDARTLLGRSALLASSLCALTALGCGTSARSSRPVPLLTEADRTADPACTESWVAALTAHVTDLDGRAIPGASVGMCTSGLSGAACLEPVETDARGWAVVEVAPQHRCLSRSVVRVSAPGGGHAITYQLLDVTPERAVLDVPGDVVLVAVSPAVEGTTVTGDGSTEQVVRFEGDVALTVRPDALEDPAMFSRIGATVLEGRDAPEFLWGAGEPVLAVGFAPDSELSHGAALSLPAPRGAAEGRTFDLFVLGGLYTPLADDSLVEEGDLGRFGSATVRGGRLITDPGVGLPRVGWIVIR